MADDVRRSPSPKRKKNIEKKLGEYTVSTAAEQTPRFVVIKKLDGDFVKDNPFFINRTLKNICHFKNVKRVNDGLLVETERAVDSAALLKVSVFGSYKVQVYPHPSLNFCKGVVSCRDLLNCSVDLIKEELSSQHVVDVRRISTRRNGVLCDTPLLVLTFSMASLPQHVTAGFYSLKVRHYIPEPMRCFKCQKFGHTSSRCTSSVAVCVCGKPLHEGSPCSEPLHCVNCSGAHSVRYKQCPAYCREKQIQEMRVVEKISYNEARRRVQPKNDVSYARVVSSSSKPAPAVTPVNIDELVDKLLPALLAAITQRLPQALLEHKSTSVIPSTPAANTEPSLESVTPTPVTSQLRASRSTTHCPPPSTSHDSLSDNCLSGSDTDVSVKYQTQKQTSKKKYKNKTNEKSSYFK